MKRFLVVFLLAFSMSALVATDACARRLGGASFGRQSFNVGRPAPMIGNLGTGTAVGQQQAGQQRTIGQNQQNTGAAPRSRWGGMLGGALLGLGLGALLSHFGIGEGMSSMISTILMLAIIYFIARFLLRRFMGPREQRQSPYERQEQGASIGTNRTSIAPEIGSGIGNNQSGSQVTMNGVGNNEPIWGIPADFDVPAFLRVAKTTYIRMQAAWDKGDIQDIHEFTTPEMFAEIRMQLTERGDEENVTDVVELYAELLGMEVYQGEQMASVKFSGRVSEAVGAPAEPFEEVWNFVRAKRGDGWVLAGIQMINH